MCLEFQDYFTYAAARRLGKSSFKQICANQHFPRALIFLAATRFLLCPSSKDFSRVGKENGAFPEKKKNKI